MIYTLIKLFHYNYLRHNFMSETEEQLFSIHKPTQAVYCFHVRLKVENISLGKSIIYFQMWSSVNLYNYRGVWMIGV